VTTTLARALPVGRGRTRAARTGPGPGQPPRRWVTVTSDSYQVPGPNSESGPLTPAPGTVTSSLSHAGGPGYRPVRSLSGSDSDRDTASAASLTRSLPVSASLSGPRGPTGVRSRDRPRASVGWPTLVPGLPQLRRPLIAT